MTRRVRLLIVCVDIVAGTGTFIRSLAGGLRRLYGDEFVVCGLFLRGQSVSEADSQLFDELHILGQGVHDDWRRWVETPLGALRLRGTIRKLSPDVIFTVGTLSNVLVSAVAGDTPVVLSDHLNMSQRLSQSRFGGVIGTLMRQTYGSRLMVAASQGIVDDLRKHFGADRTQVIPNGIDASAIRAKAEEKTARPQAVASYVIFVGRLTPQKDVFTLLRGFAHAKELGLTDRLLIAGDGEDRAALEKLAAELNLGPSVEFLGMVANPYPLIAGAKFLVLSSVWEGFAYVPVEAMALGVPCILTDCPSGPADIVSHGKYGVLVPPSDPQSLGKAMAALADDETRRQSLSQASSERAAQLSVENMTRAYRDVFHSELSRVGLGQRYTQGAR